MRFQIVVQLLTKVFVKFSISVNFQFSLLSLLFSKALSVDDILVLPYVLKL